MAHLTLQQTQAMTQAVNAFTADQQAARAAQAAPMNLAKKFPQSSVNLLRMFEVATENDMPEVWRHLVNCHKREAFVTIRSALDERASQTGWPAPVTSASLVQSLTSLQFVSPSGDILDEGLSLFLVVTQNMTELATDTQRKAQTYAMLQSDTTSPTVQEVQQLLDKTLVIPESLIQFDAQYKAYSVLLDVVLGPAHRVAEAFRELAAALSQRLFILETNFRDDFQLYFPRMMRQTHLAMHSYWTNCWMQGTGTPLPNLQHLVALLDNRSLALLPPMPSRYTTRIGPGGHGPTQRAPPTPNRGSPAHPPAAGGAPPAQVANLHPIVELKNRFQSSGKSINSLVTNRHPNPTDDGGTQQLCFHFHLNGTCNAECARRSTHRALSATEPTRLPAFLTPSGVR